MPYHLFFQQYYYCTSLIHYYWNKRICPFLFTHSYSGDGLGATHLGLHLSTRAEKETRYAPRPSPEYSCGKRNPLYPIRSTSFVSIVLYPILTSRFVSGYQLPYPSNWCSVRNKGDTQYNTDYCVEKSRLQQTMDELISFRSWQEPMLKRIAG